MAGPLDALKQVSTSVTPGGVTVTVGWTAMLILLYIIVDTLGAMKVTQAVMDAKLTSALVEIVNVKNGIEAARIYIGEHEGRLDVLEDRVPPRH